MVHHICFYNVNLIFNFPSNPPTTVDPLLEISPCDPDNTYSSPNNTMDVNPTPHFKGPPSIPRQNPHPHMTRDVGKNVVTSGTFPKSLVNLPSGTTPSFSPHCSDRENG